MLCPFDLKKSKNCWRISALVIIQMSFGLIFVIYTSIFVRLWKRGRKGKEKRPPQPLPKRGLRAVQNLEVFAE